MTDATRTAPEEPERLELRSEDIAAGKREELLRLFPETRTDDGQIEFAQLERALGEMIDPGKERYGLTWPGKADCFKTIQAPSLGTLLPARAESINWDATENLIIEGDNLEVLKLLQKSYLGKVKMIYIDPPYNTGNDFIYPDDYAESLKTYLEYTGQADDAGRRFSTNTDADGRFHSKWLNMMYPRLYLARNLLRDDGVIFISIDDNEVHNLRRLCDEIFGEDNRIGLVTVVSNPRGRQSDTFLATVHDYVVVYARDRNRASLGGVPLTEEQRSEFDQRDASGRAYRLLGLRQRGAASRRVDRPDMFFPIYVDSRDHSVSLEPGEHRLAVFPRKSTGEDGRWMWGKARVARDLDQLVARVVAGRGEFDLFVRDYAERDGQERQRKARTVWDERSLNTQNGTQELKRILGSETLAYPKPKGLLDLVSQIGMSALTNDIALDFFAGSGTTGHAVLDLNRRDGGNRRFILVQLPETTEHPDFRTIADITKERIRRVIDKLNLEDAVGATVQDRGFRVFKLAESNIAAWDGGIAHDEGTLAEQLELHVDHVRDDRSADDVLYEVLLKSGFPLSTRVEAIEIEGAAVTSVAEGALLICLDQALSLELVRALAARKPERAVFLDEGFAGDDALKANAAQVFKAAGVTFRTV